MKKLFIEDGIFETLRNTPGMNLIALRNLVSFANINVVMNRYLVAASENASDPVRFRFAVGDELKSSGASAMYISSPRERANTNGFKSMVVSSEWFAGTKCRFFYGGYWPWRIAVFAEHPGTRTEPQCELA